MGRSPRREPRTTKKIGTAGGEREGREVRRIHGLVQGTGDDHQARSGRFDGQERTGCLRTRLALRDQLVNQKITERSAEANFQNAKLARENGDYDMIAYTGDLFPRQRRENEGEVKVARVELALGEEAAQCDQSHWRKQ